MSAVSAGMARFVWLHFLFNFFTLFLKICSNMLNIILTDKPSGSHITIVVLQKQIEIDIEYTVSNQVDWDYWGVWFLGNYHSSTTQSSLECAGVLLSIKLYLRFWTGAALVIFWEYLGPTRLSLAILSLWCLLDHWISTLLGVSIYKITARSSIKLLGNVNWPASMVLWYCGVFTFLLNPYDWSLMLVAGGWPKDNEAAVLRITDRLERLAVFSSNLQAKLSKTIISLIEKLLKKFLPHCYGRPFTLTTGNQPLMSTFYPNEGVPSTSAIRLHYAGYTFGPDQG